MIYAIEGTLSELKEDRAIVTSYGISYEIWIPESSVHTLLQKLKTQVKFFTYHQIREDAHTLYGFSTKEEKSLFECLITVNGVGPKVALKLLSGLSPAQLIQSVISENISTLMQAPGVGKKMAERLIVELKDKLQKLDFDLPDIKASAKKDANLVHNDLQLALKSLGYSNEEVKQAIQKASSLLLETDSLETNLKVILKHL